VNGEWSMVNGCEGYKSLLQVAELAPLCGVTWNTETWLRNL
jgi:hypothetical protein